MKKQSTAKSSAPNDPPKPQFKAPLKPRPRLFYALLALFGVWVAGLLTLYFVTVYPHRGEHLARPEAATVPSDTIAR